MTKRYLTVCLCTLFWFANCKSGEKEDKKGFNQQKEGKSSDKLPVNKFFRNLGEPTGDEIKEYSFYMVVTESERNFYHLRSIRANSSSFFSFYKKTDAQNISILMNDEKTPRPVSYQTIFKQNKKQDIDTIRSLINKFTALNLKTEEGDDSFDIGYYSMMIYDNGKISIFRRYGDKKNIDTNFIHLIDTITSKYCPH